jgi:hypothetical protein
MGDGGNGNPDESAFIAFGSIVCDNPLGCRLGNAVEVGNQPGQHYIQCGGPAEPRSCHKSNSCREFNTCYERNGGGCDANSRCDSNAGSDAESGCESDSGGESKSFRCYDSTDDRSARCEPSGYGFSHCRYKSPDLVRQHSRGQCVLGRAAGSGSATPGNR